MYRLFHYILWLSTFSNAFLRSSKIIQNLRNMLRPSSSSSTIDNYENNVMNTYSRYPMTVSHGKGSKLYDTEGRNCNMSGDLSVNVTM
jgi:hypothetical protein